jgi:hypothetical protein
MFRRAALAVHVHVAVRPACPNIKLPPRAVVIPPCCCMDVVLETIRAGGGAERFGSSIQGGSCRGQQEAATW